jgi:hypothetical protein
MTANQADLGSVLARLETLEAREQIRDVLYRYARGADRADLELFKSCYWPDATDLHWFFNGNAHEFSDYVIPLLREIPNSQHSITNAIIEVNGDRAFVECQWYVIHHIPLDDERVVDQQVEGRYLDVFERRRGVWKIFHRQTAMEAFREHVLRREDIRRDIYPAESPAVSKRQPHDAVYQGFGTLDTPYEKVDGLPLWDIVRAKYGVGA